MTIRSEPRRWRKLRSRAIKQFDLWRGEEHLAVVYLSRDGWVWSILALGCSDQGSALSAEAARGNVIRELNRLEVKP